MSSVLLTIFVRHTSGCKYAGDEFAKRCNCRKHFRWVSKGVQHRQTAGTRSWAEAEVLKRDIEDQLSGRTSVAPDAVTTADLATAISTFIEDKQAQGITTGVIEKYTRELARLRKHCERHKVYTVQGLTRELLTSYCATWTETYPSSQTRGAVRTRTRGFLRYAYEAQWIPRVPALPKIQVDEPPTEPLTAEQYERLLAAVAVKFADPERRHRVRSLFLLMRWSGLAIRDSLTLERCRLFYDARKDLHRVVTARQKTGTPVSVPLPADVAKEILATPNGTERYLFWDGSADIVKTWTKYYVAPVFETAEIPREGNMVSHRLRDTFAVDLLEKGVPLEEVSKALGHKSIKTTERSYARWVIGRQDRMDTLITGSWSR